MWKLPGQEKNLQVRFENRRGLLRRIFFEFRCLSLLHIRECLRDLTSFDRASKVEWQQDTADLSQTLPLPPFTPLAYNIGRPMSANPASLSVQPGSGTHHPRPFLKWAGGKRQLLGQIDKFLPPELPHGQIRRYVEPFIGSGAVFFHVLQHYPVECYFLSDVNPELILVYRTVQGAVDELIERLAAIEQDYLDREEGERREYYYAARDRFNRQRDGIDFEHFSRSWIERAALLLFLNRTGFNGLFRLNSKGEFNVPFGRYPKPRLPDPANLSAVSRQLQGVQIHYGDFEDIDPWVGADTFVYFDPPYRPISSTARFTSYSQGGFTDSEQLRLAEFYRHLDARGARLMMSNSDPSNVDPQDDFFERAYTGYRIERLRARRSINSAAGKRGPVTELLILNY